jgi:hypothetical protein
MLQGEKGHHLALMAEKLDGIGVGDVELRIAVKTGQPGSPVPMQGREPGGVASGGSGSRCRERVQ